MFENEIVINELQLALFSKIVDGISEEKLYTPSPGHGHPAVWILGHLAICGELGEQLAGGEVRHPEWLTMFGPGSTDQVSPEVGLTKAALTEAMLENYQRFQDRARQADEDAMHRPHGIELFAETPLKTVGQAVSLLLTNHFGFHLAQLSSCRRSEGLAYLF
ncbi:MAG: DinB family protein [Planctomycetaceae bacterium]|nr:DinB family protein [Planctomycetaceae bacterium]